MDPYWDPWGLDENSDTSSIDSSESNGDGIETLKEYFSSKEFKEHRTNWWENYFTKYKKISDLRKGRTKTKSTIFSTTELRKKGRKRKHTVNNENDVKVTKCMQYRLRSYTLNSIDNEEFATIKNNADTLKHYDKQKLSSKRYIIDDENHANITKPNTLQDRLRSYILSPNNNEEEATTTTDTLKHCDKQKLPSERYTISSEDKVETTKTNTLPRVSSSHISSPKNNEVTKAKTNANTVIHCQKQTLSSKRHIVNDENDANTTNALQHRLRSCTLSPKNNEVATTLNDTDTLKDYDKQKLPSKRHRTSSENKAETTKTNTLPCISSPKNNEVTKSKTNASIVIHCQKTKLSSKRHTVNDENDANTTKPNTLQHGLRSFTLSPKNNEVATTINDTDTLKHYDKQKLPSKRHRTSNENKAETAKTNTLPCVSSSHISSSKNNEVTKSKNNASTVMHCQKQNSSPKRHTVNDESDANITNTLKHRLRSYTFSPKNNEVAEHYDKQKLPSKRHTISSENKAETTKTNALSCALSSHISRNNVTTTKNNKSALKQKLSKKRHIINDENNAKITKPNTLKSNLRSCTLSPKNNEEVVTHNNTSTIKQNVMSDLPTTSNGLDKIQITHLIEDQLQSNLNRLIFKRYLSQIEKNEVKFAYWNNRVREEIFKLIDVVSIEDLGAYMKLSLAASISEHCS